MDFSFSQETQQNTLAWVSPLAGLIRSGSVNGLLKDLASHGDEASAPSGARWKEAPSFTFVGSI